MFLAAPVAHAQEPAEVAGRPQEPREIAERPREPAVLVVRAEVATGGALAAAVERELSIRRFAVRRPTRPTQEPADDALSEARTAYYDLRPEDARAILEAWLVRSEESGGAGLDRGAWIEGLVALALARLALGDEEAADAALDRALLVEGDLALDPSRHPPALRQRLDRLRAVERTAATLRIDAEPEGAHVSIDGALAGRAPLEVVLSVGPHLVRTEAPGHRAHGRTVDVPPEGASLVLRPALDPELALLEVGGPSQPLPRAARAAAEASGERLFVLDVRPDPRGLRATLRDERAGRRASAGPLRSVEALARALVAAWEVPPERPPPAPPDPWPWVGLGAAVALVLGAAIAVGVGVADQPAGSFGLRGTFER